MQFLTILIRFSRFIFYSAILLCSIVLLSISTLIFFAAKDLPKLPAPLSRIIETPKTEIYAATGERLITLGGREPVPLSRISPHFINAVLAVEDHMFWEHRGINKLRTLKALYVTLTNRGKRIEGASTITQQLAKNLFFSFERTYLRKFKEMLIAFQIEYSSTKEEILHAYLNQIAFGAGAQGVEKAAQVFFGKSAADLTIAEASLLAGLPKSPTNYNPYRHYDRALKRREVVIARMQDAGYITPKEAQEALKIEPKLHLEHADARTGSYFLDALINELVEQYGNDVVFHGGIKVTATVDSNLQYAADQALKNGLTRLDTLMQIPIDAEPRPQGAIVAIDPASGAIKAMIGGRDYYNSEYNRAMNSRRQPGSAFKPFLYYTAFDKLNFNGASVMVDSPISIDVVGSPKWEPRNFDNSYRGQIILKNALTDSVNTIAARLVEKIGPRAIIDTAKLCGIKSRLDDVLSVALGTSEVTPFEMASAYSTFASGGVRHEPFMIWRVEDAFGRIIYEHLVRGRKVLDPEITYQVVDMMKSVIDNGSGRSIREVGFTRPAAGKTGTTDSYNDAWFTGFTPTLCTAIWTGFDRIKKLKIPNQPGITGGKIAAIIWAEFMAEAMKNEPIRDFPIPDGIRFEKADPISGCSVAAVSAGGGELEDVSRVVNIPLRKNQKLCSSPKVLEKR
ncbi:MAG: PBP1A family penicillin-binding protein [Desulfamplus sp.]|nr:PBP1A family penicillin-binding protein [Desulfamplus sp.]